MDREGRKEGQMQSFQVFFGIEGFSGMDGSAEPGFGRNITMCRSLVCSGRRDALRSGEVGRFRGAVCLLPAVCIRSFPLLEKGLCRIGWGY